MEGCLDIGQQRKMDGDSKVGKRHTLKEKKQNIIVV